MMTQETNYPALIGEARQLAKALGVDVPEALKVQYGPPADRFNQVLGAVAELLAKANAKFESDKSLPKAKKT